MQPDPLDDTRWALEYVNLHGISHLISGRPIPEIAFRDGRVNANDGVNVAEGTYTLVGERLAVSVEASTSLPYPSEALPEHDVFEHLQAAHTAVFHDDFLHIRFGGPPDEPGPAGAAEGEDDRAVDELVYRWEEEVAPA